jgi:hypothetical protein
MVISARQVFLMLAVFVCSASIFPGISMLFIFLAAGAMIGALVLWLANKLSGGRILEPLIRSWKIRRQKQ